MNLKQVVHKKHQFRLVLCGHKAVETGVACLVLGLLLLLSGIVTVGQGNDAGVGGAFLAGKLFGSLCPGLFVLALAAYLLRPRR